MSGAESASRKSLLWGALVSVAITFATLWPLTWDKGRDSFPLSSYPMFARKQVSKSVHLSYAVGINSAGERTPLAPELVANSEVLQARAALSRAVRSPAKTKALCKSIAARVAAADDYAAITEVRIVTGLHDSVAYLRGDTGGRERVRASCEVSR